MLEARGAGMDPVSVTKIVVGPLRGGLGGAASQEL